ncbi:MAG TPA: glutamate ABC transporter substrate-binding protein [Beutenbergiaceae bacterium]|nr:glutamate ABC transporter substrate-binding protein [Beutenbergiaceae bacterium]
MNRKLTPAFAVAAAAALALTACGGGGDGDGDTIRIGTKFDQPGLGLKSGEELTGFDVDVATYIADKLGYSADQIEWVEAPSEQRETLLQNHQVDMVVATYSITDERAEVVSFAGPYFISGQDLLVREDENRIEGPEDLDGLNLCSVSGSTSAARIKEDFAEEVQLIEQPGYSECLRFLTGGEVDAVTTDDIILAGLAAEDDEAQMKVVGNPFSEERYGIGISQDSDQCEEITEAINEMIDDGSWEKFIDQNTEGVDYTPSDVNPPTPDACE